MYIARHFFVSFLIKELFKLSLVVFLFDTFLVNNKRLHCLHMTVASFGLI